MSDTTQAPPAEMPAPAPIARDRRHNIGPVIVSTIIVLGFMTVLILFIVRPINLSENATTILNIMLGTLSAQFGAVVQYFIGSSAGSRDKDEMTRTLLTKQGDTNVPR